ncbi:MAG: cell wall hydrolase [Eubacteriales bacterium]|nr:cell wall hydrolase [Eubacteriales bacterium]
MKLRSSKAALCIGTAMVMLLCPVLPVVADAKTTNEQQQSTITETEFKAASYTARVSDLVAVNIVNEEKDMFYNKAVAIVFPYLSVYEKADETAQTVGRLYEDSIADVIEVGNTWTKISSGNVEGYVRTESLCFGEEAEEITKQVGEVTATVTADSADVYSSVDSNQVIAAAENGTEFLAAGINGNYIIIQNEEGSRGYILKENVSVSFGLMTGYTNEEAEAKEACEEAARIAEEERIAAQEAAAAAAAAEEERRAQIIANTVSGSDFTYNPTMSVSDEEIWILATVIDWEAGWESYEGKLAVANVVLNRVRSSRYANSITGVVYAPYQFSGVSNGAGGPSSTFAARLAAGPRTNECMQAALEALSGINNACSYTSFRSVSQANISAYSSYMIIGGHCFY